LGGVAAQKADVSVYCVCVRVCFGVCVCGWWVLVVVRERGPVLVGLLIITPTRTYP
jgi:hypothetical protein